MIRGIDSNTWYQITETRVDFNSSLQYNGFDIYFSLANPSANQYWQFFPLSGGNYQLRNRATSAKQLGTCYKPAEKSASKTQPCMVDAIASDKSQKWIVEYWYDGTTLRFNNVKNGTGLNMDVHPGNPLFMSQTTAKVPRQPAQHWEIKSIGQVDDGAFSTTFGSAVATSTSEASSSAAAASASASTTNASSSQTSLPTSTSSSSPAQSKHVLATGTAVGIGIGIGLAICILAALLLIRRQRRILQHKTAQPQDMEEVYAGGLRGGYDGLAVEKSADVHAQEIAGSVMSHEMEAPPAELPASAHGYFSATHYSATPGTSTSEKSPGNLYSVERYS